MLHPVLCCRFETLPWDWEAIQADVSKAGLQLPNLRHLNKSPKSSSYQEAYDEESAEIVARYFRRDIEHFGYTFDK